MCQLHHMLATGEDKIANLLSPIVSLDSDSNHECSLSPLGHQLWEVLVMQPLHS